MGGARVICNVVYIMVNTTATMPNESIALLTPCRISSHLISKGRIVLVPFTLAATVVTAVAKVFGDSVGETVRDRVTIFVVSLDGGYIGVVGIVSVVVVCAIPVVSVTSVVAIVVVIVVPVVVITLSGK